jgi:hypothetical protein
LGDDTDWEGRKCAPHGGVILARSWRLVKMKSFSHCGELEENQVVSAAKT